MVLLALLLLQAPAQQNPPVQTVPDAAPPPFEDKRDRRELEMANRPQGISVSGSIASEDRRPLPGDAWVQGFCNGSPGQGMYTRGQFRLLLSSGSASAPPGQANTSSGLAGCEVRVQLSGFFPVATPLNSSSYPGAEVGVIVLRPRLDVSGYTYSLVSAMAPKEAKKAFDKGVQEAAKNRLDRARKEIESAVAIYPKYASAWFELGTVRHRQGDVAAARECYQKAIAADAQFLQPLLQLAIIAAGERQWREVERLTELVLARNRFEFPQSFLYHAAAKYNLGELAPAEKSVRRAMELDAPHRLPKAFHLLSVILAEQQDFAGAADNLRQYLKYAPSDPRAQELRVQLADFEARAAGTKKGPTAKLPFSGD